MKEWNTKEYLASRLRSEDEEKMNVILEEISGGKYSVEDLQLFFDSVTSPLDFLRKHESEFNYTESNYKTFNDLLMHIWNSTPRTEFNGRTPSQMFDQNKEVEDDLDDLKDKICDAHFDVIWSSAKTELKELSKKELAERMFATGVYEALFFMNKIGMPEGLVKGLNKIIDNPDMTEEEFDKIMSHIEETEDDFWAEGSFAETCGPEDKEERMKTFHKKHDEDMNFNCKKCNAKISAHNKDWHNYMCDDCFNRNYFPDNDK